MTVEEFVIAVGWVFEHSPWVAERVAPKRPFRDLDTLHEAMIAEVRIASREEQLALLRAHPDLGARAGISPASQAEQAGAGLDQLSPHEFVQFREWNAKYREKFGFPLLFAVKGCTKHDILRALFTRGDRNEEEEFQTALEQVYRIARFRLEDTVITDRCECGAGCEPAAG
jgi:2-oxo-4-hydroxy-4-carboxy-5-ureidoimidazoline decarboxylase